MEEIAINVLTEMRNRVRESYKAVNQKFNYSENKTNYETCNNKILKEPSTSSPFDFYSLKQRFSTINSYFDEDSTKKLSRTENPIEEIGKGDYAKKEMPKKSNNSLNFYSEIKRNVNSDYGSDSSDFLSETSELEEIEWHKKPENGKMYGDPTVNKFTSKPTRIVYDKRSETPKQISDFYKFDDRDSEDLGEKAFARNTTISD